MCVCVCDRGGLSEQNSTSYAIADFIQKKVYPSVFRCWSIVSTLCDNSLLSDSLNCLMYRLGVL